MADSLRILILEDRQSDAELIQFTLKEAGISFVSEVAHTESHFTKALQEFSPDIILSGCNLPMYDGLQALSEARKRCPDVPFIIVNGKISEDLAIEALTRGAKDYVLKSRMNRLVPAVRRALAEANEHKARTRAEDELRRTKETLEEVVKERTAQLEAELSQRMWAEAALQEALRRFAAVVSSRHGAVLLAGERRVELANQAFCDYFGLRESPNDLVDLTPRKLIEKIKIAYRDPDREVGRLLEIVRQNKPVLGEEVAMSEGRTCVRDFIPIVEDGKSLAYLLYHVDITARRQAEEALRAANDRLENCVQEQAAEFAAAARSARSLIEASLDALVTISPEGKITDVNQALEEATGIDRAQLIGSDFSDYFTDPESAREGYRTALEKGQVRDYPLTVRHVSGSTTDVLYNAKVYRDEEGNIEGVFAAARDITERKKTEESVRIERQRLYDVLETLPVYVILLTQDHQVPFANRFFEERFGKSNGRRCYEYLFKRTEPCEVCETYKVLKTGEPLNWEWTGPDGRNYDIFDFPFSDSDGSALIMEVGIDITDMKCAQDDLRTLNETLEQKVAERTARLKEANEELEAFTYSVSHDLRAPLRAIDGFARQLAKDIGGSLNDEGRRKIGIIRDGVRSMNQLIDDLLELSRLGRHSMSLSAVNIQDLVEEVWRNYVDIRASRQITLTIHPLPKAFADRTLVKQALVNLLDNAVKFTKTRESAEIEIGGTVVNGESTYYVRDNGVGFDTKYYDKIFGVFQRLHTTAEYEGTGVGLAIVQRVVQRHGGRVWAEAAVDKGATFYFALPSSSGTD